jgi:hypothetical protein
LKGSIHLQINESIEKMKDIYNQVKKVNQQMTDIWLKDQMFSLQWWVGVGFIIIPWVLWAIFRKKESTNRLLFAGFIVMLLSSIMDLIGVALGKWSYPIKIIPSLLVYIPVEFCILPVTIMLFIQIKPKLNPFIKSIIFAGTSAYIGIPILTWLRYYYHPNWPYTYSFFILIVIYLIAHWFSTLNNFEKLIQTQR